MNGRIHTSKILSFPVSSLDLRQIIRILADLVKERHPNSHFLLQFCNAGLAVLDLRRAVKNAPSLTEKSGH
jgi:hypothetical protein